jgi:hypothetical protein
MERNGTVPPGEVAAARAELERILSGSAPPAAGGDEEPPEDG